jgi:hypothetical protein
MTASTHSRICALLTFVLMSASTADAHAAWLQYGTILNGPYSYSAHNGRIFVNTDGTIAAGFRDHIGGTQTYPISRVARVSADGDLLANPLAGETGGPYVSDLSGGLYVPEFGLSPDNMTYGLYVLRWPAPAGWPSWPLLAFPMTNLQFLQTATASDGGFLGLWVRGSRCSR